MSAVREADVLAKEARSELAGKLLMIKLVVGLLEGRVVEGRSLFSSLSAVREPRRARSGPNTGPCGSDEPQAGPPLPGEQKRSANPQGFAAEGNGAGARRIATEPRPAPLDGRR